MITKLFDIVFPKECIQSGKSGNFLSKEEQRKIYAHPECCPSCKKDSPSFVYCRECSQTSFLQGCIIGFLYTGGIKKLLLKLKYGHRYSVTNYLANKLALHIASHDIMRQLIDTDRLVISYVPSHWRRKYITKGYNQSELIAQEVSRILQLPCHSLFTKNKHTQSQVHLSKEQRKHNLRDVFILNPSAESFLVGKTSVIIIDDIVTTGSTLQECAKCLVKTYPGISIRGGVVARKA